MPAVLKAVVSVAVPLESVAVPRVVEVVVSVKTTEPVAAEGATVAVRERLVPVVVAAVVEASVVVVAVRLTELTTMDTVLDVLDA